MSESAYGQATGDGSTSGGPTNGHGGPSGRPSDSEDVVEGEFRRV
jgi:hypothetical protein